MIGTRLSSLRRMHGVSQNMLAHRLGMSQPQVCRIEQGERYPSLRFVLRFCRILRVPPNEVLFDELCRVKLPGEDPPDHVKDRETECGAADTRAVREI